MKASAKHSLTAEIVERRALCGDWFMLKLKAPAIASSASAGQFVQVSTGSGGETLLRRPFCIAGVHKNETFSLLIKVVGRGTALIAAKRPGDTLDVIGPLGNSFPKPGRGRMTWLVAGGTGLAPFLFLMSAYPSREFRLFYGAKSAADCGGVELLPPDTTLTTETGDAGASGLITEAMGIQLGDSDRLPDCIYTCGPIAMMQHVQELAGEASIPCFVSLESHMACGFGACRGCATPGTDRPFYHVCAGGPVFEAGKIDWNGM